MQDKFYLPTTKAEMEILGWENLDFIIVSGDAYVDHPSFGPAIIGRVLLDAGYKVGIIDQPDWKSSSDIKRLGRPRLAFLVTAGNIDSMVNHYSVNKIRRKKDNYSPNGEMGKRPDRATLVYTNLIKSNFKKAPIIIGGIEASLRRLAHYDYWDDKVRRSILYDCEADLLVYGMAEKQIVEIATYMDSGIPLDTIKHIDGTTYLTENLENVYDYIELPPFDSIKDNKLEYAKYFKTFYDNQDPFYGKTLVQKHDKKYVVVNPPAKPLNQYEMDRVYSLPYMRDVHPKYELIGKIPAIEEVKFSIISQRGCYGSCNFCALTFHQGKIIQSRTEESIIDEAKQIIEDKDFKGYIHDVGGPTANFYKPACEKQITKGSCKDKQCIFPTKCKNLKVDHEDYMKVLRRLRELKGVKKVFIRSGIRYDYLIYDKPKYLEEIAQHHISGQLKVAPEHIDDDVLYYMGKPQSSVYLEFAKKYEEVNKEIGKNQFIVPYLMSSHPGSNLNSAIKLALYLKKIHYIPEQVQDFYPTPGTMSTTMYYTGIDPRTMKEVYVPRDREEKAMQRALLQFSNPKNYDLVFRALQKAGRNDLVCDGSNCLIRPKKKNNNDKFSSDIKKKMDNRNGNSKQHTNSKSAKRR
jgi:uncharacterized radical SAM protein YgiQ